MFLLYYFDIIYFMFRKETAIRVALVAIALCSLGFGFREMLLHHAPNVFNTVEEDMSYAWYVPLFSLYILWSQRRELLRSLGKPSLAGALLSVPFVLLAFLGVRGIQVRLEMVAFIGLLITVSWAFFGWRTARQVAPAAGYLLFCLPLSTFLDIVTVHLRLLATSVAYVALEGFGADVIRRGTMIAAENGSFAIDVAAPCSGLRSLFALMALTAAYAYLSQRTWPRRALLFALSIPIAIAGNVMRILSICLVAAVASSEFATGFYHDYSGYIVFIVAIALMVVAGGLIDRIFSRKEGEAEGADEKAASDTGETSFSPLSWIPSVPHAVCAGCATLFFAAVFVFQAQTPPATIAKAPEVKFVELTGYTTDDEKFAEQQKVPEGEKTALPADTRIYKKMYESRTGAQFLASFVVGGTSRASIHRPELCLPSQGYVMSNPRNFDVAGRPWHVIDIAKPGGSSAMEAYTFFNQEGFRTASHTRRIWQDVIDRSVLNRVDRWVMLTVHALGATEADLLEFLKTMGDFE
jgi:exosortase